MSSQDVWKEAYISKAVVRYGKIKGDVMQRSLMNTPYGAVLIKARPTDVAKPPRALPVFPIRMAPYQQNSNSSNSYCSAISNASGSAVLGGEGKQMVPLSPLQMNVSLFSVAPGTCPKFHVQE